jgi:hypothetical protein
LTAVIDDRLTGNQAIAAASYAIDAPFWVSDAQSHLLAPQDGQFDSAVEGVLATIEITDLSPGRHTLFLRGQDSGGHWGPLSAVFIDTGVTHRYFLPLMFGK